MMRTLGQRLRTEYPVKVYQWAMIWLTLSALWAGGIYGAVVYAHDQAENLRVVEEGRCVQRVESREQIRGVFLDVYDLIDELNPGSEFAAEARLRLDETYPLLSLDDCLAEVEANT